MGWLTDDDQHEIHLSTRVKDGREVHAYSGHGVKVLTQISCSDTGCDPWYECLPDSAIATWQLACDCGWVGTRYDRAATPSEHDPSHGRVYVEGSELPSDVELLVLAEVETHGEWHRVVRRCETAARELGSAARLAVAVLEAEEAARAMGMEVAEVRRRWG